MTLFVVYLACALVGAVIALWRAPFWPRYNLLLAIAAVPQIAHILGIHIREMFVLSVVAMILWCVCNYRIAGVPVVAGGAALNMLAMAWHGGAMPVRADILADLGYHFESGVLLEGSKDIVVHGSPLWILSDWLPISTTFLTLIISPGDILITSGVLIWLLFSRTPNPDSERKHPMLAFRTPAAPSEQHLHLVPGHSARPALTRLALLAAADPALAERLLHDPFDAADAHPHYHVSLDARDRATLAAIRARARTVGEFLGELAAEVDGI
ncbi:DUF5317 family protein [Roseiflexus castenholzii]|uniref:DUF5317 family protein n=1 Tax=Roseiflexus castenholzii TaxID=120962 RepID=UPI003C7E9E40